MATRTRRRKAEPAEAPAAEAATAEAETVPTHVRMVIGSTDKVRSRATKCFVIIPSLNGIGLDHWMPIANAIAVKEHNDGARANAVVKFKVLSKTKIELIVPVGAFTSRDIPTSRDSLPDCVEELELITL